RCVRHPGRPAVRLERSVTGPGAAAGRAAGPGHDRESVAPQVPARRIGARSDLRRYYSRSTTSVVINPRRSRMRLAFVVAAVAVVGCHQDNEDIRKEIVGLRQDVQNLRAQVGRAAAAPARPQPPPGPDPAKVYAVGTAGAPSIGPAAAPL